MRLVTFTLADNGDDRIGALIDDDARIVDLALAYSVAHGEDTKMFTSMLALIDSGGAGLTAAQTLVDVAPAEAVDQHRRRTPALTPAHGRARCATSWRSKAMRGARAKCIS